MAPKLTNVGAQDELRFITDTAPTHYAVRLERFSLLAKHNVDTYETGEFEVGKYKWRLIIHPNGNTSRNGKGYISVYLAMAEDSFNNQRKGIHVVFKISIFDQNDDSYYTVQVENTRNFSKVKLEWGFDQLMSLNDLKDPSNGYLEEDVCVLGAEVYIREHDICKAERLRMISSRNHNYDKWTIGKFSSIETKALYESKSFKAGKYEWKLRIRPTGSSHGTGSHVSLYLVLDGFDDLPVDSQIYAEFTIRLIDQFKRNHIVREVNHWFTTSSGIHGWPKFISVDDFNDPSKGFLVKDKCIFEAEVTVLGVTTGL